MDFATPVINLIFDLINSVSRGISNVKDLDQRVQSLAKALQELKEARDDLKIQVDQAESVGSSCTNQVKGWLERVEAVEAEAGLITQNFEQTGQRILCCHTNLYSRYKMSKKIRRKLRDVNELKGKVGLDVIIPSGYVPTAVDEIPRRPAVGLEVMLEKVQQFLGEKDVGMVGIYGMGGVGKTTLLKSINNEFLKLNHSFDLVIWVTVSKDFACEKLQQAVGTRLGLSWDETESLEHRASKLYMVMKRKRFVLLLDDVWEGFDIEEIGIPLPTKENKCKVIFTTRSMHVCSDMDAHRKLKVEFLKEKESWELFREKVGRTDILNSPTVRSHAKTIVRKCGGLPLALITIGRAMAYKETEEEWRYAIEVLNRSPSELRGMEDVFTLLKFSFDHLDGDTLRLCLIYCSLFPEDHCIEKEQLIEYWVGEGFLDSSRDGNVRDKGHSLIGSLKISCFLETGDEETQVKMHDVVRSFSLWIASECGKNEKKFLVQPSAGLNEAPSAEKWEGAERISLMDNGITELSEIPVCPHLKTFLLQWNNGLSKILNGFFQFMPVLQVLDLSFTSLREIPYSICKLVELRHLDLSGTKLTSLPVELGGLAKLKHLDLQRTRYLRTVPAKSISGLFQLRVLNFYYSFEGWELELRFSDLEHLRHLTALGITITQVSTLQRLSGFHTLLKCIKYLYIKECEGLLYLELSSSRGDGDRLRRLSINNCCDLKFLNIGAGVGKNWLPELEVLALHGLPSLTTVWRNPVTQGCLRNLHSINIWYCNGLRNVSWISRLPNLETLYLFYCKEMEQVVGSEEEGDDGLLFQRLRTISIRDLPSLTSISQKVMAFPSLERIAVVDCPKLRRLPLKAPNGSSKVPRVYGSKEWWDTLEWDEEVTKAALLLHFMAT